MGWRRLIGSPKLQIIFHKRATIYRALLLKMTYKDKGFYGSSPPCTTNSEVKHVVPPSFGFWVPAESVIVRCSVSYALRVSVSSWHEGQWLDRHYNRHCNRDTTIDTATGATTDTATDIATDTAIHCNTLYHEFVAWKPVQTEPF